MKKMSKIALEMAKRLLKCPDDPSYEAACVALLFAHVAWNKAIGIKGASYKWYKKFLKKFEDSNPSLWNEFKITDHKEIIKSLISFRNEYCPEDFRVIWRCGMAKAKVRVEWGDLEEYKSNND